MKLLDRLADPFRPVLSDRTILKYNRKNLLIEGELRPEQIQPNSIDLTLADSYRILKPNTYALAWSAFAQAWLPDENQKPWIDPALPPVYEEGKFEEVNGRNVYVIGPGEFVLMASKEILNIPNGIISFVQGRSSIARLAIQTEQAGLIDAGFRGTITFEVFNQSEYPIMMIEGMRVAQVYFFKAQHSLAEYGPKKSSKYYNQIKATGSKIYLDPELQKQKG